MACSFGTLGPSYTLFMYLEPWGIRVKICSAKRRGFALHVLSDGRGSCTLGNGLLASKAAFSNSTYPNMLEVTVPKPKS